MQNFRERQPIFFFYFTGGENGGLWKKISFNVNIVPPNTKQKIFLFHLL